MMQAVSTRSPYLRSGICLGSPIDLSFFVTNLTNEKFYTYYLGSSFGWEAGIPNEPRTQ